ncbi:hypothetical protein HDU67_002056 [Dinochytrium kinnereticum]|nr:hypothetical protein HDU67_002056 [Dinochytrium kinnereticum]
MQLNADLTMPAAIHYENLVFIDSPQPGVQRGMLDRDGDEVARATSLVRYAPNSSFNPHTHGGGEEFLVLDGIFADEHGRYPAGSYIRNKIGSTHAPSVGPDGCLIFVKLRWMNPEEPNVKILDATSPPAGAGESWSRELYANPITGERVRTLAIPAHGRLPLDAEEVKGGTEVLVVEGSVVFGGEEYGKWSWVRIPPSSAPASIESGAERTVAFIKTHHLLP